MHVISGKFQRRALVFPKDRSFRPTKAIVRESVFNVCGSRVVGASFLDLCSGSGAIGIEAESRGADVVVCVDRHVTYMKQNKVNLGAKFDIVRSDALRYLASTQSVFDIIYFDPVWADIDLYKTVMALIVERRVLSKEGWLLVEHPSSFQLSDIQGLTISRDYQYGNSKVTLYRFVF